ncbi:MAG TPA: hypothetical protein VNT79_07645 [Phycisphaerae bacterium]|nr:hypothetical protein [Phycisphaerae bacterium]
MAEPIVAKALSEEEAAAEISIRQAREDAENAARVEARQRVQQEKEARRAAKLEKKASRQAAKASRKKDTAEQTVGAETQDVPAARQPWPVTRFMRAGKGGFGFSFSTGGLLLTVGMLGGLVFGAYVLGRRSSEKSGPMTRAAAVLHPGDEQADIRPRTPEVDDPELQQLLTAPPSVKNNVVANQPQSVDGSTDSQAANGKKLNYLQIEWFPITVDKSGEDLRHDLEQVRLFLKSKGIDTFAREYPRGFILNAAQGYSMSSQSSRQREALRGKVEKLGQEYFQSGGRYQFKDCLFVSHKHAMGGRPVSFKE